MSDTESASSDIVTTPPGVELEVEPGRDLNDTNYPSSYPNECVCCLESLSDCSYPIPCCLRPLCRDCATALTQPGQSLICPNCGLTNGQDSANNLSCDDLIINYLIHRSAKLIVDIKSRLRQYYQALKQLKSDQEHNNANVVKILHRIGSKTNPILLQQLRYHDKNFQLAIEQNQTVVRQLHSCVQYLTSLPAGSDLGNVTNPLVFLTRLAQVQACYDRIQRESKIVQYLYEPLHYHYHPLGGSVGPNHMINKLRQLYLAQGSTDPRLQPYKTIPLAEKNPDYEQMCGEYWHSWFSQCRCHLGCGDLKIAPKDPKDPQLVEYRCYSGGILIIHYSNLSKPVITPLVVPYPVIRTFNCEYVVFQTLLDSTESKQLSVISVEALITNSKAGLALDTTATVLLEGGAGAITDLALTPDKILVTSHQGIYCYDLADLARPIRELLPTVTGDLVLTKVLVPHLVLARPDVIRIEPCGVYFYTIFTGADRYYRPTGFGQIDLESLGQSELVNIVHNDVVMEDIAVDDFVIEDYIVLEDGSIIFESKARDAYGGGWSNDKQVCIWTGGQLHRQPRNDLVGLVGLNLRLTSQGDLMVFDEESDCVKFYRGYRECQD